MHCNILLKRVHVLSKAPVRSTDGSGAFDVTSVSTKLTANNQILVDTGLQFAFSSDFVMLAFGRSGYAKYGIKLTNGVGVIDSDYRGNLLLLFDFPKGKLEESIEKLRPGNRVGQIMLLELPQVSFSLTDSLPETVRGVGGFGSTGS